MGSWQRDVERNYSTDKLAKHGSLTLLLGSNPDLWLSQKQVSQHSNSWEWERAKLKWRQMEGWRQKIWSQWLRGNLAVVKEQTGNKDHGWCPNGKL